MVERTVDGRPLDDREARILRTAADRGYAHFSGELPAEPTVRQE
jgi:hypothetical protein